MLLLFLSIALSNAQQRKHDVAEWRMYQRVQADKEAIADIWRPHSKLLADYRRAQRCYTRFHLYRATSCDAELANVDRDLGNVEATWAGSRQGNPGSSPPLGVMIPSRETGPVGQSSNPAPKTKVKLN
jgi:hypothetical protein